MITRFFPHTNNHCSDSDNAQASQDGRGKKRQRFMCEICENDIYFNQMWLFELAVAFPVTKTLLREIWDEQECSSQAAR